MKEINIISPLLLLSIAGGLQAKRPNILLMINDDQTFIHTGFAGSRFVNTPGFDYVAANGIYFTNCYAGSPGSAPSRSALVTGRHHWQNEEAGQHASPWPDKFVPYVDILHQGGYHTGYTGKGVAPFQYARNENDSLWRKENAAGKVYNEYRYIQGSPSDPRTATGISPVNYFENFRAFMQERTAEQPFYFWFGSQEPHRDYEKDSWKRNGKSTDMVDVPGFLPDTDEIKADMLDYAVEIEWSDSHLCHMLNYLDSIGELDNTIILVTADNGMPFPRAKANCFEYGVHVPLAISYPAGFPSGRCVDDPVGFVDIAPTLLELAGLSPEGMLPLSGRSIVNILRSEKEGTVDPTKKYVFSGRERHSSSRWQNLGYPQRSVRSPEYLFIWNIQPERWPAGDPYALNKTTGEPYPMYGIDEQGIHHPEWAFTDVDAAPSKSFLIENHGDSSILPYFKMAFNKRPEFELYNIQTDPYCLDNLSGNSNYTAIEEELKTVLLKELEQTGDPRVTGLDQEIFESYIRYSPIREFPKPD
ncbi:MAG: sulfatase [Tannerellaceae bacterium]|nr:sulfatase [Tannerellaceae bacterium]